MAAHLRLPFGTHIAFTYGPLGFLVSPGLYYLALARTGFLFSLVFSTALFTLLVWSLRRTFTLPVAVVVAYLIGGISRLSAGALSLNIAAEDVLAMVAIICIWLLSGREDTTRPSPSATRIIWVGLGVTLALFSLLKSSLGVGIGVSLLLAVVFAARDRPRILSSVVLGAIFSFAILWFSTGNGLSNVSPFLKNSASVITGYAAAMEIEAPGRGYTYWLALLAVLVVLAMAVIHLRRVPSSQARVGVVLITLASMWFLFKEGFVRHDYHDLIFFVAAPLLVAAFPLPGRLRMVQLASLAGLALVAAYVSGAISNVVPNPITGASNFISEATTLGSANRATTAIEHSRRGMRHHYLLDGVTPEMVSRMAFHTADVSPWEQSLIWAYPDIRFDPLPVFQDYSTYTPSLDTLDADYLASSTAPQYVLRRNGEAIDGHDPYFEGPLTQLTIECRYTQVLASANWQLLEHRQDRCGPPKEITTVRTGLGHWVRVPPASGTNAVVTSIQISQGLWSKAESILYKPPEAFLALNSAEDEVRFVTGTASDLHVLRAPESLGYSSAFVPTDVARLSLSVDGHGATTSGLKITFFDVPMKSFTK